MLDFQLHMPTRIVFGRGEVHKVGAEAARIAGKALVVTGRFSTRKTGVLQKVLDSLAAAGVEAVVFDRIEPNPRTHTVDEGGRIAREENCGVVIGLGGGSAMDAAKAIAAVAISSIPSHEYISGNQTGRWQELLPVMEALPIMTVPTLAATGSEANSGGVLTHELTKEKGGVGGPALYPKVAIIDPELTYTVSPSYTADGAVDMFTHLYEAYLTGAEDAHVQDHVTEGLMRAAVEWGPVAVKEPENYEARAALMWASTLALIGIPNSGRGGAFPVHAMEHTLSAWFDISHGRGLAILAPAYFRVVAGDRPHRIARLGRTVFGVQESDDRVAAEKTIKAMIDWFKSMDVYLKLSQVGIDRDSLAPMAADAVRVGGRGAGFIQATRELREPDVLKIYEESF
ncbi:iron-containing alcohol dehydrogenase [Tumebacillus sp. ITR2]|uniref:Iron-containing alcohol dehydrogenase n=1 Tax=Tumebacillus amylolyticus TaxID=2801339 RepID=A0ABS1J7R2_9BACL|nr:iron-containing alcohol dehydrogenase [Tumebacillus amylolyticus]MBL0386313.1 iron-containing alcohol dehydrogenase [Tumebacillus amylolyticus]